MSTNINFVNSLGLGSNTRVDFNLPRTILLKGEGRAVADGGVAEAELCSYNTLNGLNYNALLRSASLICTPNGYKEGTLYSVIPSDGSGDMSVVRATTATRVNSAGLVELVPYNLMEYSQALESAAYTTGGTGTLNVTPNYAVAPDGTMTADRVQITRGLTYQEFYQRVAVSVGQVVTLSFWAKSLSGTPTLYTNFNAGYDNQITFTTDWVRYEYTFTGLGGLGSGFNLITWASLPSTSTSADLLVWGAQLNEGTIKDYQKTETRLNIPRLDYSNGTCPSLLVEPQRTNLSLYSEQFDNGYWLGNTTKTANNTIAPNGINSADRINATAINFFHRVNGLSSVNSGTAYTFSVYAKANTLGFIQLALNTGFTNDYSISPYANFNLTTGIISQIGNGATAQIESLGNGWYRCSITATSIANALGEVNINLINSGTLSAFQFWSANATDSLFIWGAQLEAGSYPTSYIPTTSASVTRNADVVSKTGISSLIGQTEGTMFFDLVFPQKSEASYIGISNGTTASRIIIGCESNLFFTFGYGSGDILSLNTNTRYKIAMAYNSTNLTIYANGSLLYVGTGTQPTSFSRFAFDNGAGTQNLISSVNATALWKTRLTNTQLAQLTTI